nr:hypothetical protein [Tanacetum cinerariifolium]
MSNLLASITARITQQVKSQLPQIQPKEVSNLAPLVIKSIVTESLEHAVLAKDRKDKDKDEDPSAGSDRGLKKKKKKKDAEPTTSPKTKESKSDSSKGSKSQSKSPGKSVHSEEPEFKVVDSDMLQDQEVNLGKDNKEPKGTITFKHDWFTKPERPQKATDPDCFEADVVEDFKEYMLRDYYCWLKTYCC